jgi:hypothetical protein
MCVLSMSESGNVNFKPQLPCNIMGSPWQHGTAPAVPRACSIREVYVCGKDGLEVYVCVYFARRQTRAML